MIEENVVRAAGAAYCMDEVEIVRNVEDAGFVPKRRNMHYEILGDPDVPPARGAASAGAGDGPGRWRHLGPRRADATTRRAARPASGSASRRHHRSHDSAGRGVGRADRSARRFATGGWPSTRAASSPSGRAMAATRRRYGAASAARVSVALLPGLVNAHTHLELSWLRDRVPPANAFTSWVKQLIVARDGAVERPDDPVVLEAAAAGRPRGASRPGRWRLATSAIPSRRWACWRRSACTGWCSTSCSASRRHRAR